MVQVRQRWYKRKDNKSKEIKEILYDFNNSSTPIMIMPYSGPSFEIYSRTERNETDTQKSIGTGTIAFDHLGTKIKVKLEGKKYFSSVLDLLTQLEKKLGVQSTLIVDDGELVKEHYNEKSKLRGD